MATRWAHAWSPDFEPCFAGLDPLAFLAEVGPGVFPGWPAFPLEWKTGDPVEISSGHLRRDTIDLTDRLRLLREECFSRSGDKRQQAFMIQNIRGDDNLVLTEHPARHGWTRSLRVRGPEPTLDAVVALFRERVGTRDVPDDEEAGALLEAVAEHAEDLAPREALGEYLAGRGDLRADFIRAQFGHARGNEDLFRVQLGLGYWHGHEWDAALRGLADSWEFHRGFVETATLDAARLLEDGLELYRRAPILHLNLTGVRPVAAALFASPLLGRLLSLSLTGNDLGDEEAALLAASGYLSRLRWLDLSQNEIGLAGLEALAASSHLPALYYLGFVHNPAPDPTPSPGGVDWYGKVHDMDYPPLGAELMARHGDRRWLSFSVGTTAEYPPPRR